MVLGLWGRLPRPALSRSLLATSLVLVALAVGNALVSSVPQGANAQVTLGPVRDGVAESLSVRMDPPSTVDEPTWFTVTAWQGGDLHVDRLVPAGDGSWRTTEPVPVSGDWKTLLRVHEGRSMSGVEIYLPADPALDASLVPADPSFIRPVIPEHEILQRELKPGVPVWLFTGGSVVVLGLTLALVLSLAWGVGRTARCGPEPVRGVEDEVDRQVAQA
ncbi:MAG: hypothetical protein K0S40_3420 [Actinomycetospora sp.]|jgi:hypothetical protein|nr:hypothetical protein [Actinomycetospora sp.]